MKICAVIPAYNERGNLKILTSRLNAVLKKLKCSYKILFVLQGNDGSRELLIKLKREFPKIDFLHFPYPLGIGLAYRIGFKNVPASYSHIITLDADLNHDPENIKAMLSQLKAKKADLVIGSRFIAGGTFGEKRSWKKLISILVNKVISAVTGIKIKDLTSGYRIFRIEVIRKLLSQLTESGYPAYMEMIIKASRQKFSIIEHPINYRPRIWGKSKIANLKTFFDYTFFLPKIFLNS